MSNPKTYSQKLKDPRWQKKRLRILERDNFKCTLCDDETTELHIHHLKYSGNPWEAKDDDLITTCTNCHKISHLLTNRAIIKVIKSHRLSSGIMYHFAFDIDGVHIISNNENEFTLVVSIYKDTIDLINKFYSI